MGIQYFNRGGYQLTTQNIGCPSIMTPSTMGKTKNAIIYFLNVSFPMCPLLMGNCLLGKADKKMKKEKKRKDHFGNFGPALFFKRWTTITPSKGSCSGVSNITYHCIHLLGTFQTKNNQNTPSNTDNFSTFPHLLIKSTSKCYQINLINIIISPASAADLMATHGISKV